MGAHIRAGVAIFNAGGYHAAHDAWEDRWLALEAGTDDERFLHGLIQYTAAVHHAQSANWVGVRGLAESGAAYLDALPDAYRGVNVREVRAYLAAVAADPEHVERARHPALTYDGAALRPVDLDFEATTIAATVLAGEVERYDPTAVHDAIRYAREAVEAGGTDAFVALVMDFVTEGDRRDLVYGRLERHVARRRSEEEDVDGLF